ncbi:hypothetical protein ACI2OX_05310 [Bacillus sp. N9]
MKKAIAIQTAIAFLCQKSYGKAVIEMFRMLIGERKIEMKM